MQIDQTTLIALIALIVSVCGIIVSIWSAVVSHKALNHNRNSYDEQQRIAFEKERSQLLEIFNDSRKLHDKTLIEIETLITQFDSESDAVKALLRNHKDVLNENLKKINGALRQANSLWSEVAEWDERQGLHALAHHQARYRALVLDDFRERDLVLKSIQMLEENLKLAKNKVEFDLALKDPIITDLQ